MQQGKISVCQAEVTSNEQVAKDTWRIQLKPEENFPWEKVIPGKFVCLAPICEDSTMVRPFSIFDTSISRGTFTVLYKIVGKNTTAMTKLVVGQRVNITGPLGNDFNPNYPTYNEIWLVAGGIGIVPLNFFDRHISYLLRQTTRVFYGSRTKEEIVPFPFYTREPLNIATDDGTAGLHGFVTGLLEVFIKSIAGQKILVITCGPKIMMAKVAELCEQAGIDCHVILETVMACGLNNCKGCSIKTTAGMKSVCHDGPVFNAKEVIWDELC